MILLIYIIKTVLISGLLFGYYWLFLRNRFFHRFNRFFLLSIPVISFLLPAFHFSLPEFWNQTASGSPIRLLGVGRGTLEEAFTIYGNIKTGNGLSWEFIVCILSIIMSAFLFIRFYKTLCFLRLLPKNKTFLKLPDATIYFVSEKGTPFSFFKSIFWGPEIELNSKAGKQILMHELFHVKNNHSLDILLLEIVSIFLWYNPFIHFIRQELRAIHEYAADAHAVTETNTYEYASLLLWSSTGNLVPLTHPFFKNQIKKRITMITKSDKTKNGLLGRMMILPLIAILICLFSFKMQNHHHPFTGKNLRVVIDAGHGGVDPGTTIHGVPEKNINLIIAKKIKELSKEYNVEVIMTREKDELSGQGENIGNSLKYRTELPGKENADLFISIHANGMGQHVMQDKYSGFDIYIPDNTSKVYEGSVKLASIIADYIKPDYIMAPELKQRKDQIQVLDNATVPAILIECGYMDNKSDLAYLQDEKNQEKIARDILEGIRKYSMQTTSYSNSIRPSADTIPDEKITEQELNKLNSDKIASMNVDKKTNLITIIMKDGKKYVAVITPEMIHSMDSARHASTTTDGNARSNPIFTEVEVEASFPGGQEAWYQYLMKNLKYPAAAVKEEIQGTVIVKFIVRRDGRLTDIQAISGPESLRDESIRAVKESGKWIPAKQNGYTVDSYHDQPFNFKLEKKS
jgi:TonB family protein